MGWINSPDFLCAASETVTDNENLYALDPDSTFMVYYPTAGAHTTADGATASPDRLQYVDAYMDDLLCSAQGYPTQQHRVSETTICSLKEISPSLLGEVKDSAILKKALARYGDWATIKEILGCVINTHRGTLDMFSKQHLELISLLEIPDS